MIPAPGALLEPSPVIPLAIFLPLAALAAWLLSSGKARDARDPRVLGLLIAGAALACAAIVVLNLVYEPRD